MTRRERNRGQLRRIIVKDDENTYVFPNDLELPRVGDQISPVDGVELEVTGVYHHIVKKEKPYVNADIINILTVDLHKKKKKDKEQEFLDKALVALEAGGMAAVKDLCRNTKGKTPYILYSFIEDGLQKK